MYSTVQVVWLVWMHISNSGYQGMGAI